MAGDVILIIGVGNTLRCDDGAGLLLAEAIRAALDGCGQATELRQVQQLLPELAEEIAEVQPRALVLADCAAGEDSGDDNGGVREIQTTQGGAAAHIVGSHALAPAQLVALARRLYQYAGDAWLVTAPGADFAHGEGVSASAQAAIATLVPRVIERLR